jgi:hypothetical protein
MPAEAGIQSGADIYNFKDLDSRSLLKTCRDRFRGNESVFSIRTQSLGGEGNDEGKWVGIRKRRARFLHFPSGTGQG